MVSVTDEFCYLRHTHCNRKNMNLMSVLQSLSPLQLSSLSPNTTVPALQKHVLQKPLCGRNGMNGACMMLVSFKKEREENEKKATQFLQGSQQVYPHWSGSLLIWSDVVCVLSVYFICVASCSTQSKSMLFTLAEATPAFSSCRYLISGLSHLVRTARKDMKRGLDTGSWILSILWSCFGDLSFCSQTSGKCLYIT